MKIYKAKENVELPNLDLLTYLFESKHCEALEDSILHVEASNPGLLYTKRQARNYTKRLAHTLRHLFSIGAQGPGRDVVTLISSGQCFLPIAFYATIGAGGVCSSASAAFTPSELARQVRDGDSQLIICSHDALAVAKEAARIVGLGLDRVVVLESNPAWRMWNVEGGFERDIVGYEELEWERVTEPKVLEERPIVLLYSSGTTGVPKGVPLSNQNLVAEAHLPVLELRELLKREQAEGKERWEYRTLAHLPAAHIAGVQGYFINPFSVGGTVFWMQKFEFEAFLRYNKMFGITFFFTVPPIYLLIAKSPAVTDHFKTVRWCISGAAPMGKDLQKAASEKLSVGQEVHIGQTWGLSETTGSFTLAKWDTWDETGSVSGLLPNMEMRLVDADGNDVGEGEDGEVLARGPVVFRGYRNRDKETRESFKDGWFCTGDVGMVKDDLLYIVDRKKELIKYKGLQVAPAELEGLLLSHELIADAAVIGVAGVGRDEGTEVPRAYIVADQKKISEKAIKDFVKKNASSHKQLRGGVIFVNAISKSPSGKILRKDLRELAKREGKAKL